MTRDEGNEILSLLKLGLSKAPAKTISEALVATGDLGPRIATSAVRRKVMRRPQPSETIRVWRSQVAGGNTGAVLT